MDEDLPSRRALCKRRRGSASGSRGFRQHREVGPGEGAEREGHRGEQGRPAAAQGDEGGDGPGQANRQGGLQGPRKHGGREQHPKAAAAKLAVRKPETPPAHRREEPRRVGEAAGRDRKPEPESSRARNEPQGREGREREARRYGNDLAAFFVRNADRLGVLYVIWYRQIWLPANGWRSYGGSYGDPSSDHTNHVHLSVL